MITEKLTQEELSELKNLINRKTELFNSINTLCREMELENKNIILCQQALAKRYKLSGQGIYFNVENGTINKD